MRTQVEWKVGGQQGEGVDSTGEIFAKALFKYGYYLTTYKQFMSRIKGGHTNFKIFGSTERNYYAGEKTDILLCLDADSLEKNKHELHQDSVAILEGKDLSIVTSEEGFTIATFPMKQMASELGNALAKNMIGLGVSGGLIGLPKEIFFEFINDTFAKKGDEIIASNKQAVEKGYELASSHLGHHIRPLQKGVGNDLLYISGNEATAFGSFMAGCRFLSAYPITPASEIMEWMSAHLPSVGGTVMQVEDEIAGITFAIGASFGGARSMTSTSGPGLSLKTEALGMAGLAEVPIVIVNSQRGGPSTGLPTKHEQSDLQHMLFSTHGEIPRIVLYPATIEDAFYIAAESFNLADYYQCPVIIALDLAMSMNKTTVPSFDGNRVMIDRGKWAGKEELEDYKRYQFTQDGISPRVKPGTTNGAHMTSSNEHDENGYISEDTINRNQMMKKRLDKTKTAKIQKPYLLENEPSDTLLIGMGSTYGVIREVAKHLGYGHLHIQQLHPLPFDELQRIMNGKKIIVIENNYNGQLLQWLRQHFPIHNHSHSITQYDGNPFDFSSLLEQVKELN